MCRSQETLLYVAKHLVVHHLQISGSDPPLNPER